MGLSFLFGADSGSDDGDSAVADALLAVRSAQTEEEATAPYYGANGDPLTGDSLDDLINGTSGDDMMLGRSGDDTLDGGDGRDTVSGGGGVDSILGGSMADSLDGNGGDGEDTLIGNNGADTLNGEAGDDGLDGVEGSDLLIGSEGNDTIFGLADDDTLLGGAGDDSLVAVSGEDVVDGGADNDTINGGAGDDILAGGEGADLIVANEGNDTLLGNAGADTLSGSDTDDVIIAGFGKDTVEGGAGNDTIFGGNADLRGLISGGAEVTAEIQSALNELAIADPTSYNTGTTAQILAYAQFDGVDVSSLSTPAIDTATDYLSGGDGDDHIHMQTSDVGVGGAGNDTFYLEAGPVTKYMLIPDYVDGEDALVIEYDNSAPAPVVTIVEANGHSLIHLDDVRVADIRDAAGTLEVGDISLVGVDRSA